MTLTPSLIVDIVLGIICICVIIKYSIKGFLKTILDLARLAISVILAIMFRGVVANLLNGLFMSNVIHNWVYSSLTSRVEGISEAVDFVRIYEDAPQFYSEILAVFDLDFYEFEEAVKNLSNENVENVTNLISDPLATMLSTLIAVVAIFTISMIVLFFVVKLIDKITKIKLIGLINKVLGVCLGVLLSSIIVWLLCFALQLIVETVGPMYPDVINSSLTEDSMIINILKEAGLFEIFDSVKEQVIETIG